MTAQPPRYATSTPMGLAHSRCLFMVLSLGDRRVTDGRGPTNRGRVALPPRLRHAHAAAARQVEDARLARVGTETVARGRVRLPARRRPALARAARRRRRAHPARAALSLALAIGEAARLRWQRGRRARRRDPDGPTGRRRAHELCALEDDHPRAELILHLGGGRERALALRLVAENGTQRRSRGWPATWGRGDHVRLGALEAAELGRQLGDAVLGAGRVGERETVSRRPRVILHLEAREMVERRLRGGWHREREGTEQGREPRR